MACGALDLNLLLLGFLTCHISWMKERVGGPRFSNKTVHAWGDLTVISPTVSRLCFLREKQKEGSLFLPCPLGK